MRLFLIATFFVATGFSASAWSQATGPQPPGRLGLCAACHGETGRATLPVTPHLAGQPVDYLRSALAQYRDGRRNSPVMRSAIGPLNQAELDALALWYSQQTPQQGAP